MTWCTHCYMYVDGISVLVITFEQKEVYLDNIFLLFRPVFTTNRELNHLIMNYRFEKITIFHCMNFQVAFNL